MHTFGPKQGVILYLMIELIGFLGSISAMAWTFQQQGEPDYELDRGVVGNGTVLAAGGGFELVSAVGQPAAVVLIGGTFVLTGGFFLPAVLGDITGDGVVALDDVSQMTPCMGGPLGPVDSNCINFDVDGDTDMDLEDLAEIQRNFLQS